MFDKLNEKDKKTIKYGGIAIAVIIVLLFGSQGYSDWNQKTTENKSLNANIKAIELSDSAREKQLKTIPVFEMPKDEQTQKSDFRSYLDRQFNDLGIVTSPWQEIPEKSSTLEGYDLLSLNSKGTCRFDLLLELLASLKYNPYLAGIEELNIECDPQNSQQATFSITLSTFTKRGK